MVFLVISMVISVVISVILVISVIPVTAKTVVYFTVILSADNQRRMTNSLVWNFKEG